MKPKRKAVTVCSMPKWQQELRQAFVDVILDRADYSKEVRHGTLNVSKLHFDTMVSYCRQRSLRGRQTRVNAIISLLKMSGPEAVLQLIQANAGEPRV